MQRVYQQRDQDPRLAFQKGRTKEGRQLTVTGRKESKVGDWARQRQRLAVGRSGVWPSALLAHRRRDDSERSAAVTPCGPPPTRQRPRPHRPSGQKASGFANNIKTKLRSLLSVPHNLTHDESAGDRPPIPLNCPFQIWISIPTGLTANLVKGKGKMGGMV